MSGSGSISSCISATAKFEVQSVSLQVGLKKHIIFRLMVLTHDPTVKSTLFHSFSLFQVSGKPFTLETLDRKTVPFDEEIKESCVWLRCVPALDRCQHWSWRVRDGKLELRE